MNTPARNVFLCNGASQPKNIAVDTKVFSLSYLKNDPDRNVNLLLPKFVDQVYHLPTKILDLLEIAAYVFAADRLAHRGPREAVEYHAWPRSMNFFIRVREPKFWNQKQVKNKLIEALVFMTGDHEYSFEFFSGHSTPPVSLFDSEEFAIAPEGPASVVLFSGGLDSLSGVLERLQTTNEVLYLISHSSRQPSTKRTQNKLVDALKKMYKGRINHYSFECGLTHERAAEETQRTRAFLFGTIAFALAHRLSLNATFAYENGVTSLNLLRRQDLINAKASRTTHPKTHYLMSQFLSEVEGSTIEILNPFWDKTKADIFTLLNKNKGENLIGSAVSCSKTFQLLESATHCGCCFQCIDRRLAAYAAGLQDVDNVGIYSSNIFIDSIGSLETKTTALDYIRQAIDFAKTTEDAFSIARLSELADITDYVKANNEQDAVSAIWQLCRKHGNHVVLALKEIRNQLDDLKYKVKDGSLLQLINDREYLKDDPLRLAEKIAEMLAKGIPIAFQSARPNKETELNDQIDALLGAHGDDFKREYPSTQFALSTIIPDHEATNVDLIIETKYIRKKATPSKVSEGIAADITKYPQNKFILFVIYDPDRAISKDEKFKQDFENKRPCLISIIR